MGGLSYLQDLSHFLGGDGDQPLDSLFLQLPLLLNDLLEDVVNVDFALSRNLGSKYSKWQDPRLGLRSQGQTQHSPPSAPSTGPPPMYP